MKILLAGDTHGNLGWIEILAREALRNECSIILQLGDFGYWEHTGQGRAFLDATSDLMTNCGLSLLWIDGNHENHQMLRSMYVKDSDEFVEIRPNLSYIPRGCRWTWGETTFLGVGGAYSIDQQWRKEGTSWWPEETITEGEIEKASTAGHADIMITHDCPTGVNPLPPHPLGNFPRAYPNRQALRSIVDVVRPTALFHGHYHHRHTSFLHGEGYETRIEGLANDGVWSDSWLVLEIDVEEANDDQS